MKKFRRTWLGRCAQVGALVCLVLYVLNVPYYSGWGGEHLSWRMEHGRLKLELSSSAENPESFYIAPNSEGLRFAPEWDYAGSGEWMWNVPLWVPFCVCLALARLGRRRREGA